MSFLSEEISLVRAKTLCTAQLQRGAPNFSRSAPRCDINRFASLWASSQPLRYRSTKASVASPGHNQKQWEQNGGVLSSDNQKNDQSKAVKSWFHGKG